MAKNTKTITTETGKYENIREKLKVFDGLQLDVGYFAGQQGAKTDSNFLLPDIAAVQEFGSHPRKKNRRVPKRSFLAHTFDRFKNRYRRQFRNNAVKTITNDTNPKRALLSVGENYRSDVVNRIVGLRTPKNAPWTIKAKGNDNPLIDSGTMKNNIRIRVVKNLNAKL